MRRFWLFGLETLLSACAASGGGTVAPVSQQNPLIARVEVWRDPISTTSTPIQLRAWASGQGTMSFHWTTTGGLLSVASESFPAATASLTPSMTLWLPPQNWGSYQVHVTVSDSGGGSFRRTASFQVDRRGTTVQSPYASGIWLKSTPIGTASVGFFSPLVMASRIDDNRVPDKTVSSSRLRRQNMFRSWFC